MVSVGFDDFKQLTDHCRLGYSCSASSVALEEITQPNLYLSFFVDAYLILIDAEVAYFIGQLRISVNT